MIRFIILFGFTYFFLQLHVSGNISKYINMKYSYLSFSMIFVMGFLSIYQLVKWVKEGDEKEKEREIKKQLKKQKKLEKKQGKVQPPVEKDDLFHNSQKAHIQDVHHSHDHHHTHEHDHEHHHHDHGHSHNGHHSHDHSHEENTWYKKVFVYGLLLIPLITGLFLPVATLNSTIVKAKGFHFAAIEDDDPYSNHQVLRPNSSLYYGKDEYSSMEQSDLKTYGSKQHVTLNDGNYFRALESIYNYPGNYENKTITLKGFVYRAGDLSNNQLYLLRFGIIHCIADAGVYGMMVDFPKDMKAEKENTWLQVTGTLSTIYNHQFQGTIPYLQVTSWKVIQQPSDPYVYRKYN
ncbi:TIGR03943 family putative permease subunit [Heyndrickxia acidicola]|uniref:TIGR03943 family protein n=1 Tax=Heyndrickxia acidicola TaxID=209389 RepID=A0ABU6MHA4_9BACI|nr:TIGR03943 family protein [Heyndrickxia acidicola]MED1202425.1 TIGR03943 family protein [Heyndrickxia acidicola]